MRSDPYSPCPAGTGKKLKFCCRDLMRELQTIEHMLAAEQSEAVKDHIRRAFAKFGERACLRTYQCMAEMASSVTAGDHGQSMALDSCTQFVERFPENPVALAFMATLTLVADDPEKAVELLQKSLRYSPAELPQFVRPVVVEVARYCVAGNHVPMAVGLYRLIEEVSEEDDPLAEDAGAVLRSLIGDSTIPLALRQDYALTEPTEDAAWKDAFDEAKAFDRRGAWSAAADIFQRLADQYPDDPAVRRNLAVTLMKAAREGEAAEAWRTYASMNVPLDEAIDAEATAHFLDKGASEGWVELKRVVYELDDLESLVAALGTEPRAKVRPVASEQRDHEQPPPRAVYDLLDRPIPVDLADWSLEDVPHRIARVELFGKQTDRPARAEVIGFDIDARLDRAEAMLRQLGGGQIDKPSHQEVLTSAPRQAVLFVIPALMPAEASADRQREIAEQYASKRLEDWLNIPQRRLGGKTPLDVAGDEAFRVALEGLLGYLSQMLDVADLAVDLAPVRQRLNLPPREPVSDGQTSVLAVPPTRWDQLAVEQLSDDELCVLMELAFAFRRQRVAMRALEVALERPGLIPDQALPQIYLLMASLCRHTDEQLAAVEKARNLAEGDRQLEARVDLGELRIRVQRRESEGVLSLIEKIRAKYRDQPEILYELYEMLNRMGLAGQRGRGDDAGMEVDAEAADEVSVGVTGEAAPEIWTPEAQRAAQGKSKLWLPGEE